MRNKTKKMTMFLTATAMTACLAVALPSVVASAEGETTETTTYTEIQSAGFYMEKGAQVRYDATNPGIRFVTYVTKAFYDSVFDVYSEAASIEFYTEIDRYGNTDSGELVTVYSSVDFETAFESADTVEYYGAITYENLDENLKAQAYAMELEAYAKCRVLDADGNVLTVDVEGTEKPVIIGAERVDSVRSMRLVSSALTLRSDYETGFTAEQKDIIEKYLGTINNSTDFNAYETVNESEDGLTCAMDGTITGSYNKAYVNSREVGTVADGVVTFDKAKVDALGLKLGESCTFMLFDDANNVYTSEFMYVTKVIENQYDFQIFAITTDRTENLTGYYVLKDNLTLNKAAFNLDGASGYEWHTRYDTTGGNVTTPDIGFAGTFDGRGCTLTSKGAVRMGLWGYLCNGATIKNVKIHFDPTSGTTIGSGNALTSPAAAKYLYSMIAVTTQEGDSAYESIENVYVDFDFTAASTANYALVYKCTKELKMKNVIVENANYDSTMINGVIFNIIVSGSLDSENYASRFENVYAIAGTADDPTTEDNEKVVVNIADWSAGTASSATVAGNDNMEDTGAKYQISTIYRYATLAELYDTLTDSNPLPWDLEDGALVWNQ